MIDGGIIHEDSIGNRLLPLDIVTVFIGFKTMTYDR
jgi:hypothetical protein